MTWPKKQNSQHRKTTTKTQDHMTPPKHSNFTVTNTKDSEVDDLKEIFFNHYKYDQ
jgi:hypothetical protein